MLAFYVKETNHWFWGGTLYGFWWTEGGPGGSLVIGAALKHTDKLFTSFLEKKHIYTFLNNTWLMMVKVNGTSAPRAYISQ